MKTKFKLKRFLTLFLVAVTCLLSSCHIDEDEVVMSYDDKVITKAIYQSYYSKNKEYIVSLYQSYYNYYADYPDVFKNAYGFLPDNSEDYWETKFWEETLTEYNMTAGQFLDESTVRACKEYLVYEKIASDYGYRDFPEDLLLQFEKVKESNIKKYGSSEAWNIDTICQMGITASELMDLSLVSAYGTVLPSFIFGENGKNISDEEVLATFSDSIQFKYSVFYYQIDDIDGDQTENKEDNTSSSSEDIQSESEGDDLSDDLNSAENDDLSDDEFSESSSEDFDDASIDESDDVSEDESKDVSSDSEEKFPTADEYNKYYNKLMYSYFDDIKNGKKSFDDVYKESDDYKFLEANSPNGVVFKKDDFKEYFQLEKDEFRIGDLLIADTKSGIFLIQIVDFSSDNINKKKSNMINEKFSTLVESYFDSIEVNASLLSKLTEYTND